MTPPPSTTVRPVTNPNEAAAAADPLETLTDSERLELAIRFSRVRMCAALSHGHSFEQSIFKLPSKCSACQEVVWGPFNRGCTCLTCKVTAHRSCTGMENMPRCPTKYLFADFCRAELGLPSSWTAVSTANSSKNTTGKHGPVSDADSIATATALNSTHHNAGGTSMSGAGDLGEWAEVEGETNIGQEPMSRNEGKAGNRDTSSLSPSLSSLAAPTSSTQEVRDLDSSFSWSPFSIGSGRRKRLLTPNAQSYEKLPTCTSDNPADDEERAADESRTTATKALPSDTEETSKSAEDLTSATDKEIKNKDAVSMGGLTGFSKISVAGGVVGAVLAGPSGAMVGLKLGAVIAAGRWSAQGLWQRIEKDRKAAGAEAILVIPQADGTAVMQEVVVAGDVHDVWAQIAKRIEGEEHSITWKLDPEQESRLEQGECDAAEVAMFVVGKVLTEETALPNRLYRALLAEFHSRHRLCCCVTGTEQRRVCSCACSTRRRSRDTDIVSVFPRSSGSRRGTRLMSDDAGTGGRDSVGGGGGGGGSSSSRSVPQDQQKESSFFAQTPGLEKTFSFVEETELIEGEGSDTFAEDDEESSVGGEQDERRQKPYPRSGAADRTLDETAGSLAPSGKPTAATVVYKDLWRNSASRMDSWVELEGAGCDNCGGRVASTKWNPKGQFANSLEGGVEEEEDEEGLEFVDSWATAEAPPCWCMDGSGLSTSPDSSVQGTLQGPRRESYGRKAEAEEPGRVVGTKGTGAAFNVNVNGRGDDVGGARDGHSDSCEQTLVPAFHGSTAKTSVEGSNSGKIKRVDGEDRTEEQQEAEGGQEAVPEPCDALRDVHGLLRELTRAVLAWCPLITASDEAAIHAVNCIDQRVFAETYGPVYGRIASRQTVRERDATLARRTRRDALAREAAGRPTLAAMCRSQVLAAFRAAGAARTGRDKLTFLVKGVEELSEALPAQATTDTLLWSLCRHLAAATIASGVAEAVKASGESADTFVALPRPHAEVAFVEQFMRDESWLMGKEGYVLTTVDAALHVLLHPDMSDEIFADVNPEGRGGEILT